LHHLKGFHLALAAHLPGRNEEGWKLTDSEWTSYVLSKLANGEMTQSEADHHCSKPGQGWTYDPPISIKLTQHLRDDLYAMKEFFSLQNPPEVQARR
jgi:hypothetical protein